MKVIAIVSGGLDSSVMAVDLKQQGHDVDILSFWYGQRHNKELSYAAALADRMGMRYDVVNLTQLGDLLSVGGSSLLSASAVPEGHYAEDSMTQTIVPNRNMIMLSVACGVAVARKANTIATAVHAGDHFIYPDCRPEFIFSLGLAMLQGNQGMHSFVTDQLEEPLEVDGREYTQSATPITAPYLEWSKADIAFRALELGLPFDMTWSCYKGGEKHCGKCGTCVERLEAIHLATKKLNKLDGEDFNRIIDVNRHLGDSSYWDTTEYENDTFWMRAVEENSK